MLAKKYYSTRGSNVIRNQPQLSNSSVLSSRRKCCQAVYKPVHTHETSTTRIEKIVQREYKTELDCVRTSSTGDACCPAINVYSHPVKASDTSNKSIVYRRVCYENDPEVAPNHSCKHL